jgi:hypothetical protein
MHDDRDIARGAEEAPVELRAEQLHPVEQGYGVIGIARIVARRKGG